MTCSRSQGKLTERRVPNPLARRLSPWPLPPGPSFHHRPPSIVGGGLDPSRAAPPPTLLPLSSVFPIAATHFASLLDCCGSRSLGVFASVSVPCAGEPALSCAVVGRTAQAHCSPPPSSLFTSSQLPIRVAARVMPTGCSVHRRCGGLASCMHRPLHCLCLLLCAPFFL